MRACLGDLNKEQYEAAVQIDGFVLILAGAGTGKTKTLVSRVAYMLEQGTPGENILLLTFTNKAAREMKERICKFVGDKRGASVLACTFHSFCARVLRDLCARVGFGVDFAIIDTADATEIMDTIRSDVVSELKKNGEVTTDFPTSKRLLDLYGKSVNTMQEIGDVIDEEEDTDGFEKECAQIIREYNREKKEKNRMDYDDLLKFTVKLFHNPDIRAAYDRTYAYIMCDEYQDTNLVQDEILNLLSRDMANLAVVGDDNQSIYSFRGAEIENILTFQERHEGCRVIKLIENYRSSQEILDLSNAVMEHAMEGITKELQGQFHGNRPCLQVFSTEFQAAGYVADRIEGTRISKKCDYKDMAVIVRNSMQSAYIEQELVKRGVPYEKFGGQKFFDKEIVRYLLSFLRVTLDYRDDIAWMRVLKLIVGIGSKTAKRLMAALVEKGYGALISPEYMRRMFGMDLRRLYDVILSLQGQAPGAQLTYIMNYYYPDVVRKYINDSRMSEENRQKKLEGMEDDKLSASILIDMVRPYRSARQFLDDIALDQTASKQAEDYVNITTIHSAKGLEYDTVFVLSPVQGMFPRTDEDSKEDREELRCLYVALTRAKRELEICVPRMVFMRGSCHYAELSHHLAYKDVLAACEHDDSVYGIISHELE